MFARQFDVVEQRISRSTHLVLGQAAARGAAELAEMHRIIDESSWLADQRIRRLNRPVDSVAMELVVLARWPQRLPTTRARQPPPAVTLAQARVLGDLPHDR